MKKISELASLLEVSPMSLVLTLYRLGVKMSEDKESFCVESYVSSLDRIADEMCTYTSVSKKKNADKLDADSSKIRKELTPAFMRNSIRLLLEKEAGLVLLTRESRSSARFLFERPDGEKVIVQSYVYEAQPNKDNQSINFTIYNLNDHDVHNFWYAFAVTKFDAICFFSRKEIQNRFYKKNKTLPNRTTIKITPAIAQEYSIEARKDEIRGG